MHLPHPSGSSDVSAIEQLDESRVLVLTSLPPRPGPSFALNHPYVELVYAPSLGPSAVLLARHLGRVLAAHGDKPARVCPAALSLELGMRASSDEPLGARPLLRRAIDRLERHHVVRWHQPRHLGVLIEVPPVSERVLVKLPPAARRAHDHFVEVIDLRDRPA